MGMAGEPPKVAHGSKKRKARRTWERSTIEPTDNKGMVVKHSFSRKGDNPGDFGPHEEETHAFGSGEEALEHLKSHGIKGATSKNTTSKNQPDKPAAKGAKTPKADEMEEADNEPNEDEAEG